MSNTAVSQEKMLSCSFLSFTILSLIVSKRYFLFDFILSIMRLVKAAEPSNSWPKIWWPMQRCRTRASCPGARNIIEATPCMHAQQYLAQDLVAHAEMPNTGFLPRSTRYY